MSKLSIDALAQEIRRVDGNHSLGASALAEALMPFIAAHLAAQDEWPSETDMRRAVSELTGFDFEQGELQEMNEDDLMRLAWGIAALQYVRPPVGVVSDEDIAAATKAFFDARVDVSELDDAGTSTRICAALESYASRHAPTKD